MTAKISVMLLLAVTLGIFADENEWFVPLGSPPRARPRRISGGEGFPPLPLPVTPLRRSERKREPTPPKLIGKVIWGETASFTYKNGKVQQYADWNLCPDDLAQLLRKVRGGNLGLEYGSEPVDLATFHGDPTRTPVLFFSGTRTIRFSESQTEKLRHYVRHGGMVVFDSIAGSPYFYNSARMAIAKFFPEEPLRLLPLDHPLYHIVYDASKVRCPTKKDQNTPLLEAIYIGCRPGVLLSKYGLGCGWDGHEVPYLQQAIYYDVSSAARLGVNLVAYAVAYAHVGREEAKPELFGTLDHKTPTDEFVLAQIKHRGAWNVHPGGAAALLRRLRQNTALRVSLKRVAVTPGRDSLAAFSFLYLTGLDDFQFNADAVTALQSFLRAAGTLVINNGMGLSTFDRAVRRELKKVVPRAKWFRLPSSHPLYHCAFRITTVDYSAAATRVAKGREPYLLGINIDGELRVIYSPFDLEAGWQGCEHILARSYRPESAWQLGVNIIIYAMTH